MKPVAAYSRDPGAYIGAMKSYEYQPHYTHRSTRFEKVADKWEPTGDLGLDPDGVVSQETTRKYMEDLKFFAEMDVEKDHFRIRREFWRTAHKLILERKKEDLKVHLAKLLSSGDPLRDDMVRDLMEIVVRNDKDHTDSLPSLDDLNLKKIAPYSTLGNKSFLIAEYPEWRHILEYPNEEIPRLVNGSSSQIHTLRNIIDELHDRQVEDIIMKSLVEAQLSHLVEARRTVNAIIEGKPEWHFRLVQNILADLDHPYEKDLFWKKQIGALIKKGDPAVLDFMAEKVFQRPKYCEWIDEIKALIQKGSPDTLNKFSANLYNVKDPFWDEVVKAMIKKDGMPETFSTEYLGRWGFYKSHVSGKWPSRSSELSIKKGNSRTPKALIQYGFSPSSPCSRMGTRSSNCSYFNRLRSLENSNGFH